MRKLRITNKARFITSLTVGTIIKGLRVSCKSFFNIKGKPPVI